MKLSKYFFAALLFVGLLASLSLSCKQKIVAGNTENEDKPASDTTKTKVIYAGARSSSYGINPFPSQADWSVIIDSMATYFPGTTPCAIWIVGVMGDSHTCMLEFPSNGQKIDNVEFASSDKHEQYLSFFDRQGIKVFLQVESADANIDDLIDVILKRYGHHNCVKGFGVDAEWYRVSQRPGWGMKVTDDSARRWEERVKSYNSSYRLFIKHWDRNWMPPNYRGDIIFVDDSQGFKNVVGMIDEFCNYWADHFKPNTVFFQYGYGADKKWWQYLSTPPRDIGNMISSRITQDCGFFWVDFTLGDVF